MRRVPKGRHRIRINSQRTSRVFLALFRNFISEKEPLQRMPRMLWQSSSAFGKDTS